jgi:hypothetical protein
MEQSVETQRRVSVSFLVTAELPEGALVKGAWKVTDAGEIARIFGEEVLTDAAAEAGFQNVLVRSIVTAKGPSTAERLAQEPIDTTTAAGRRLARERQALMPPR